MTRYTSRRNWFGRYDVIDTAEPEHRVCVSSDAADAREVAAFLNEQHTTALMNAYRSAVIIAAYDRGLPCYDFGVAADALPRDVFAALRKSYALQIEGG